MELDCSYQKSHQKKSKHGFKEIGAVFVNAAYDFNIDFPLKPFLGGGLGYFKSRGHSKWYAEWTGFSSYRYIFKDHGLAWQAFTGVKYSICKNIEVGLEYRLLQQEKHQVIQRVGLSATRYF